LTASAAAFSQVNSPEPRRLLGESRKRQDVRERALSRKTLLLKASLAESVVVVVVYNVVPQVSVSVPPVNVLLGEMSLMLEASETQRHPIHASSSLRLPEKEHVRGAAVLRC